MMNLLEKGNLKLSYKEIYRITNLRSLPKILNGE